MFANRVDLIEMAEETGLEPMSSRVIGERSVSAGGRVPEGIAKPAELRLRNWNEYMATMIPQPACHLAGRLGDAQLLSLRM